MQRRFREVLSKIRNLAGDRKANAGAAGESRLYHFADLTLDAGQRVVRRGTTTIELPRLSFDLLGALVRSAPDSLSTDQLMDQVWRGAVVSQATVAKRVELLRQGLGDDSNAPRYIALVRGYGYRLVPEVREAAAETRRRLGRLQVAALMVLVLLSTAAAWFTFRPVEAPRDKSIAVLPFVAVSMNPDDQIFADGLTEELSHVLARSGELKVTGRISSFYYKDREDDVQSIGKTLGVAHILKGSIRRSEEKLRVTVHLISADDGFQLWSASYDRQMSDIIGIQENIAHNVAARLHTSLGPGRRGSRVDEASIGPEAYAMYLRAASLSPYGKGRGLEEAQRLIERVTVLAPDFAPGWNRLAAIHGRRLFARDPDYPYTLEEAMPTILDAVTRALTIDPDSAEAYANLGGAAWVFEGAARKAAPLIERAMVLDPWDLDIVSFAADFAKYIGRLDEALELEELLVERDPLCESCRFRLAKSYMFSGQFHDAEHQLATLRSMSGGYHWDYGVVLLLMHRTQDALETFRSIENAEHLRYQGRAMALSDLGRDDESQDYLARLEHDWGDQYPQQTAQAFAYVGQADKAFEWLQRSLPEGTIQLQTGFPEPLYDRLRDDPRWMEIMRRIGRTPEQMQAIPFSLDSARTRLAQ